jgi:hypothetical protein
MRLLTFLLLTTIAYAADPREAAVIQIADPVPIGDGGVCLSLG